MTIWLKLPPSVGLPGLVSCRKGKLPAHNKWSTIFPKQAKGEVAVGSDGGRRLEAVGITVAVDLDGSDTIQPGLACFSLKSRESLLTLRCLHRYLFLQPEIGESLS